MKIDDARLSEDARMARRVQALLAFKEQYVESTIAAQVIGTSGSEQSRVALPRQGFERRHQDRHGSHHPDRHRGQDCAGVSRLVAGAAHQRSVQRSGCGAQGFAAAGHSERRAQRRDHAAIHHERREGCRPAKRSSPAAAIASSPRASPVGKVASVSPGKDLFLNIRVIPSSRLDRLEEVLVVTKIEEKMPDTKDLGPLRASDILAERLPGVPNKAEVDAAGNAKPGDAAAAGTLRPAELRRQARRNQALPRRARLKAGHDDRKAPRPERARPRSRKWGDKRSRRMHRQRSLRLARTRSR